MQRLLTSQQQRFFARSDARARQRAGFTLLEVLVAVGAVAVVAAGLAVVFDSVGKTVSAGRRASRINQVGQLIKQQLTSDFGAMTREGFLVIRQSYADADGDDQFTIAGDAVPLSEAESSTRSRPRRVDEILFFQTGSFTSERAPVVPGGNTERALVASAGEAMVYYGHGNRWNSERDEFAYVNVEVNQFDISSGRFVSRLGGADGQNATASDWVLARKQVLLTGEPKTDDRNTGDYFGILGNSTTMQDGECQVAGQPAAASVFRAMNRAFGPTGDDTRLDDYAWYLDSSAVIGTFIDGGDARTGPVLASGTIDIATTSLREIRRVIENINVEPLSASMSTALFNDAIVPSSALPNAKLSQMRLWMDNAMPTGSADELIARVVGSEEQTSQARVRVATQPPGLLGCNEFASAAGLGQRRGASVSRANRQLIASGALLTSCTEFVVEWTFGQLDGDGNLVWHGPPRRGAKIRPYPFDGDGVARLQTNLAVSRSGQPLAFIPALPQEIYGEAVPDDDLAGWNRTTLTSTFGSVNPLVSPDVNGNDNWSDPTDLPGLLPQQWPTQIRVRISITDPLDPTTTNESTFEYVFSVPSERAAN